ncbi:DNA endonuclease RBBP8 isoform X2 [Cheilinus undulatus]|uniref:DNA endonuclease RBBP8 isoform X2 n=1 Tax=Cheilinus undulatus TaxID=241271 RepID=UPI001BD6982C|nr:DNA endonuclease RBBP8 isoform X2 [Cheilinus undulatus]
MSSPSLSSETPRSAHLFDDLWRQLRETHHEALQELEAKVSKLKKERCLDAQKLEVFYNRNQQLKEQNKSLQDTVSLLEERLHSGECDRCAAFKENLKNNQEENLCLIEKLKHERNLLEEKNKKLQAEVEKLKTYLSEQRQTSPDQEEGIIPDSPILPNSLPAANKLRKRRKVDKMKHVRYAETPLLQSNSLLFNEPNKEPGRAEVLVPNTCELDTSQTSNYVNPNMEIEIAETCGLELLEKPCMQSSSKSLRKFDVHLKPTMIHSPDPTTERSPSLLPRVKRLSENDSVNKAKRKKEDSEHEDRQGENPQQDLIKQTNSSLSNHRESMSGKVQSKPNGTLSQKQNVSSISPDFKRPQACASASKKGNTHLPLNNSQDHSGGDDEKKPKVDSMWSIDPALALSMYDSEQMEEEEECPGELVDTDCTWVSHSVLQQRDKPDCVPGLGEKANDSLDMLFDTTAYGEYKSYNGSHLGQSQPCDDDDEDEEEGGGDENEDDNERDPDETTLSQIKGNKASRPAFAHVAVIRKKDERRKLKGATCKECEVYYAHLPEEEKQKKLSSCSRHRFLYIPPCTPENFWEVGFPSTQTCIERGYIREEKNPEARTRRRQPLNALFSPKRKQQESNSSFSR